MRYLAAILMLNATSACSSDVLIGALPPDGGSESPGDASPTQNGLVAGSYTLEHGQLFAVKCTLSEDSRFSGLTPTDVGLVNGPVTLTVLSAQQVALAGDPIEQSYGVASLTLSLDPDEPDDLFYGESEVSLPGPEDFATEITIAGLYESGATSTRIDGQSAAIFSDGQGDDCGASFLARLVR